MFKNIRPEELPLLAKAMSKPYKDENGVKHPPHKTEQIFAKLESIDQMLAVRKVKILMLRKHGYQKAIEGIIGNLCDQLSE